MMQAVASVDDQLTLLLLFSRSTVGWHMVPPSHMSSVIISASLSINRASALLVYTCRLDHLSVCRSVGPKSVPWQNG